MKPAQFLHTLLNTESDRARSDGVRDSWLAVLQDQVLRLESQRLDMQPAMQAVAESLVGAAVRQTLECLEENMSYVLGCGQREAATFLYAPFEVPRDVMEMAAVQGTVLIIKILLFVV